MSTSASSSTAPAGAAPAEVATLPPPRSNPSPSSRSTAGKSKQLAPARKRKPARRRGARADEEDESEVVPPAPLAAAGDSDSDSDSDSDFVPSPGTDSDDDSSDGDDDDEHEGAAEPRTPASASVEQLPPRGAKGHPAKAVLAGPDVPPSWSDAVDAAEEGDSVALPTLDFADLSIAAVQALPTAPAASAYKPLSKSQLALQRRDAKSAALKVRDPAEWEKKERERTEREEAKRVAKKERQKEKRREKKAAEKAARHQAGPAAEAPVASTSSSAVVAAPAPAARPAKPTRPVIPSRPSRTGLALGLVNPASTSASPASSPQPAPSASSTPVVPTATRQPAFLPRDAQGRPIPQPFSTRGRSHGRGGFAAVPSRWGAQDDSAAPADKPSNPTAAADWGHSGFDELESERGASAARGRGRGRGGLGRGGKLQSGINPRFAHLPFHPSHRFHPGALPKLAAGGAPEPVAPEATTAAPDDELFREEAAQSKDVVKLPDHGAAQISLAVKGTAAARAAEQGKLAEKENTPPQLVPAPAVDVAAELRKQQQQGASVLYAADPARFASGPPQEDPAVHLASYEQQLPEPTLPPFPHQVSGASSFLHQVPPHLQQSPAAVQAPYIPRHSSPAYFAPPPHAYYADPMAMAPSPGATPTPTPPFAASHTPTSAYFLPPRPNKRVEIKAPSRDGQSPVPLKTHVMPPAPDAYEAAQQARISQLVREAEDRQHYAQAYSDAASSVGAVAGSSSPASTRAAFLPGSSPVMQQQPAYAPAPYFGGGGAPPPPPASAPMYNTYTHSSHDSFDGAPYPSAPPPAPGPTPGAEQYGLGHFAPPHHQHFQQQQQAYYPAQLQHPFQQVFDPYAAAAAAAQAQAQAHAQFYGASQQQ